METAVKVLLEWRFSILTEPTYFEIRVLCEVQNRGLRPYFVSNRSHSRLHLLTTGGGIVKITIQCKFVQKRYLKLRQNVIFSAYSIE